MPRRTPPDRLAKLLSAAAEAFVEHGFHRTQMDDVADRLGTSKGTIYRHVPSKDALFAAVVLHGDDPASIPGDGILVTPPLKRLLALARADAEQTTAAYVATMPLDAGNEFAAVIERLTVDLYETEAARRVAIMVLDRCAAEIDPDWYTTGRYALVDGWNEFLDRHRSHLSPGVDVAMVARTIVELVALWAVKMPWDPAPRPYRNDATTVAAMVQNLTIGASR